MKIVYCLNSIRGLGGVQRVTIVKVNALSAINGNEVYVVVTDNKHSTLVQDLSPAVHLIDLDINYYKGDRGRSKIANIFVYKQKMRCHRKLLEQFLSKLQPDVVDLEDIDMLADLLIAATNEAMRKADDAMEQAMGAFKSGLNLPF